MALAFPTPSFPEPVRPVRPIGRPHLRVIEGGRSSAAVYRRRRLAVAAVAALLVVGAGSLLSSIVGGPSVMPADGTYLVSAGESLWQVAGELTPHANRLEVVSLLAEANGGSTVVQAGQRLVVPGEVLTLAG